MLFARTFLGLCLAVLCGIEINAANNAINSCTFLLGALAPAVLFMLYLIHCYWMPALVTFVLSILMFPVTIFSIFAVPVALAENMPLDSMDREQLAAIQIDEHHAIKAYSSGGGATAWPTILVFDESETAGLLIKRKLTSVYKASEVSFKQIGAKKIQCTFWADGKTITDEINVP